MGLDATVYRNRQHLPPHLRDLVTAEARSGELLWHNDADERKFGSHVLQAASERIGNVSLVALLAEEVEKVLSNGGGLVLSRVLHSGSHSGDFIAISEVEQLGREIEELDRASQKSQSTYLRHFISQMRSLVGAARREGTGICF